MTRLWIVQTQHKDHVTANDDGNGSAAKHTEAPMTFAQTLPLARNINLAERASATLASLRARYAKHREYLRTLDELELMSDRDLADINLSRFNLREIAQIAVYGAR